MKIFFTIFFVSLGVIFFCILLALVYFWIADPYNIKPFIFQSPSSDTEKKEANGDTNLTPISTATSADTGIGATASAGGGLTEGQKNALELVGINPNILPSKLTPEQEKCFVDKFGQARVDEIKAGAIPTAMEVLTGRSCL